MAVDVDVKPAKMSESRSPSDPSELCVVDNGVVSETCGAVDEADWDVATEDELYKSFLIARGK